MDRVMKLLEANSVMNLATSSGDKPRSSIMEYIMINGNLMFATDPATIKAKNLERNPKFSLTVGGMPAYAAIDGTVRMANSEEAKAFDKALFERHPEFESLTASGAFRFVYFKAVFETIYYTEGMSKAEIIKVR